MIPYEDLCRALDIHNRKLRGEEIPEEAYPQAMDDEFDIVEAADADMQPQYADADPDVTAETAVPDADFGGYEQQPGSGEYAEGTHDSGAVAGQPAEGMAADQYSSGQQQQYQEGYEQPAEQQYQEGAEQPAEQPPGTYPDDQDPNAQQ